MNKKQIVEEIERLANEYIEILEKESKEIGEEQQLSNIVLLLKNEEHSLQRLYASPMDIAFYMKDSESTNRTLTKAAEAKNVIDVIDDLGLTEGEE